MTTRLADADLSRALRIRHFEQRLLDLFAAGEVSGTAHTCLGQEYIPVALAPLLAGDFIFSNHRGHGHYLAMHDDADGLLAEILGRVGAVCSGVGGSQHVFRENAFLSTGVQGESLPVAVGVGLDFRRSGAPHRLAVAFIGDGTWGEGAVYEALNMAALWRVPLLVVVEHNGIAQSTPAHRQLAGTIAGRCAGFGIQHTLVTSTDIEEIRANLAPLISTVRTDPAPLVVEFRTERLGPHSKGDDTRDQAELDRIRDGDWLRRYQEAYPEQFATLNQREAAIIDDLVVDVVGRPHATWRPT
ncbi:MAG TPA: thiamine pyrophosphate-dependent dehydrogenase E1 component subunit alpha [Micromonosporaceae bacterium]